MEIWSHGLTVTWSSILAKPAQELEAPPVQVVLQGQGVKRVDSHRSDGTQSCSHDKGQSFKCGRCCGEATNSKTWLLHTHLRQRSSLDQHKFQVGTWTSVNIREPRSPSPSSPWVTARKLFLKNVMMSQWGWPSTLWLFNVLTSSIHPLRHLCKIKVIAAWLLELHPKMCFVRS